MTIEHGANVGLNPSTRVTAQTITPRSLLPVVSQSSDTGDNLGRTVGRALSCVQNEGHSHGEEEGKKADSMGIIVVTERKL